MRPRPVLISLTLVVAAVVLQTTLFAPGRILPFGVAPNLVALVLIACIRYLEPEASLLVGFTAGLVMDTLGGSPLGLWAMSMTAIAYAGVKLRPRAEDGPPLLAVGVVGLTFLGQLVFVLVGTLFGLGLITDDQLLRKLLLPGVYNLALAYPVFLATRLALRFRQRSWVL
jgi:rod shape-determining protein MreD